jgi:hypothetical protein
MPSSGRMALGVLLFLTGCAASPAGKCNLAGHSGVKAFLPGFHSPENRKDGNG